MSGKCDSLGVSGRRLGFGLERGGLNASEQALQHVQFLGQEGDPRLKALVLVFQLLNSLLRLLHTHLALFTALSHGHVIAVSLLTVLAGALLGHTLLLGLGGLSGSRSSANGVAHSGNLVMVGGRSVRLWGTLGGDVDLDRFDIDRHVVRWVVGSNSRHVVHAQTMSGGRWEVAPEREVGVHFRATTVGPGGRINSIGEGFLVGSSGEAGLL